MALTSGNSLSNIFYIDWGLKHVLFNYDSD